jgi:AcrR family transcriptional regulator
MSTTVLPTHQQRSRHTLDRLLRAAAEVLDEHGLEGATVPRIAARARLTPGAIYRRFPDKDALLREVCLRVLRENVRHSQDALSPDRWAHRSAADLVRHVVDTTLRGHARHRGLLRALTLFTLEHGDERFVSESQELQWKVFQSVSALLLARRNEIGHASPESAVRFALLMVGVAAKNVIALPRDPKQLTRPVPELDRTLRRELPKMVLAYLKIEDR